MNAPADFPELLADWAALQEDIAFARALRKAEFITPQGTRLPIQWQPGSDNAIIDLRGLLPSGETEQAALAPGGATLFTQVTRGATQSFNNATFTTVSWDTGTSNAYSLWSSGTPTRLTVPAGQAGIYYGYARISYQSNNSGARYIYLLKNGSGTVYIDNQTACNAVPTYKSFSFTLRLVAGDYLELQGYQDSGGSLNISSGGSTDMILMRIGE